MALRLNFRLDFFTLGVSSAIYSVSFKLHSTQMARVFSSAIIVRGCTRFVDLFPTQAPVISPLPQPQSQPRRRRFASVACLNKSNSSHSSALEKVVSKPDIAVEEDRSQAATTSLESTASPEFPNKDLNRRMALLSTAGAVGLFLSTRLDLGGGSLKDLSASALSYEEALSNGKPTVVEFYADWCEVCRELAKDIYKVEQQYKDQVNFVMLNVDNTKWEQELDEFGVEGIPHFAFLDKDGNEEGNIVGRLPRQYFLENIDALAHGEASVPHARAVGQFSSAESRRVHQVVNPRSHG